MKKKKKIKPIYLVLFAIFLVYLSIQVESKTSNLKNEYPKPYRSIVHEMAEEYDVDENLIYAIMRQESKFNTESVSSAKARGLLQITEPTFEWLKMRLNDTTTVYEDLFEPEHNIRYGVYFLSLLKQEFKSSSTQLAAYNAGMNITKTWLSDSNYSKDGVILDVIPYPETSNYVKIVLDNYRIYEEIY
ncbi:lytic transglycosylase domain-containing protein [Anaerorhabdus sp.]|uniref:lytic transglycosylase domain-containing protein n=1 Tax=Anaerorhabdus sp. TaxID=1872524 RepID=UPI002FC76F51